MGDVDLLDTIRQRYAGVAWRERRRSTGSMLVWNFSVDGNEIPSMRTVRVRRVEPAALADVRTRARAAARETTAIEHAPRVHIQTLWRPVSASGVTVRADLFECLSQADAEQKALWLLGEFQSSSIWPTADVGDFAFGAREDGVLLFVRANIVCLVRNIGRERCSARPAALAIDAHVRSTPAECRRAVDVPALENGPDSDAEVVEVMLKEPVDSNRALPCRKFLTPVGEISVKGSSIVYCGPRAGLDVVAVYEL